MIGYISTDIITFNIKSLEAPNCCGTMTNFSDNRTYGAMSLAITNYQGLLDKVSLAETVAWSRHTKL